MTEPKNAQEALSIAWQGIEANAQRFPYIACNGGLDRDRARIMFAMKYVGMWPQFLRLGNAEHEPLIVAVPNA
jgi:hypothetical protein